MKILKLHIDSYRHLENLDFDFTYPSDYKDANLAGKPLKKICFIGQSATGKTGLLEVIYEEIVNALNLEIYHNGALTGVKKIGLTNFNNEIHLVFNENLYTRIGDKFSYRNQLFETNRNGGAVEELINVKDKKTTIYFKSNLISEKNLDLFTKNPIDIFEKYHDEIKKINNYFEYNNIIFDDDVTPEIWLYLLYDVLNYRKNFTQIMTELVHKGYVKDIEKFRSDYEKWQKDNPNVLELFAEKFNPILEKLNLEVDSINTEYSIPIKNKHTDEIIAVKNTSTGTKGLLLSFLPLFKLDTKDSIILIDEPERSLYPDMQMDLMEHYQRLATDAQFIVATHSPFIAASFEPEERFILYFDEEGKVAVRSGTSPIGDDPNDMLYNDFGVDYINSKGKDAYKEYLDLKQKIYFEKDENKKEKLLIKSEKLGDLYNFRV